MSHCSVSSHGFHTLHLRFGGIFRLCIQLLALQFLPFWSDTIPIKCCLRTSMSGACRPFAMPFNVYQLPAAGVNYFRPSMSCVRPCSLTWTPIVAVEPSSARLIHGVRQHLQVSAAPERLSGIGRGLCLPNMCSPAVCKYVSFLCRMSGLS